MGIQLYIRCCWYRFSLISTWVEKNFGELAKVRGIIQFRISPHEQRAFAGAISQGILNFIRRIRSEIFFVATPLLLCYLVYDQTEKRHTQLLRKNPADFEHEK